MNFDYEIEKINPINISAEEFKVHKIPHSVRKSIALYNKSILNLKVKCADLAINDLKKALSLNPDFCEAIKLLGLCYVYKKDFKKAEKVFKKLAKHNIYSMLANEYLQQLKSERTISKALDTIKNVSSNPEGNRKGKNSFKSISKIKNISGLPKKLAISFFALAVISSILGLIYWKYPSIKTISNKVKNTDIKKNKEVEQPKVADEKNAKINEDYKKLQKNLETTKLELDNEKYKKNISLMLNDAEKFYGDGEPEKALDNLITLKALKLDDAEKSRFDALWNNIKTRDVWTIYNQANSLYKQGKYVEALPKLIKVHQVAPELDIMPWVIYQMGNCYKETNDNKNALALFEKVKKDYPNTQYAVYSQGKIEEIGTKKN
ncbi:tetratricopeptide repeat protein [Clostridium magnum]|uniref:Tetratricopeptide repeat protein n=1 Tax=Clostridium magnum DSM 2767 TaxID=1121326 RepID=A0A161WS66_9CLOT|nr:tetratricopeptide repeat protein [Clostridium magnum]KZL89628.1 tetratricopeptide repeat protein [Clostridium magnum DSM 2767]SHH74636.1 Tetratricopeptide repeat-containing protein [Clostridium magnum DSM 2767]